MEGNTEGILYADVDFSASVRARMVLDVAGHYNRSDVYRLTVNNEAVELVSTISSPVSESAPESATEGAPIHPH